MANPDFKAHDRVRVTNQNSQYRNHLGEVIRTDEWDVWVRIDGHERAGAVPLKRDELSHSTQKVAVHYGVYRKAQEIYAPE
jgi:hypothetical protein